MRAIIAVLGFVLIASGGALAQIGPGFGSSDRPVVGLLGCDVATAGGPEVVFVQLSDGLAGFRLIGPEEFEGESCADVLSLLLGAGLQITTSRPVLRTAGREVLVYDLRGR